MPDEPEPSSPSWPRRTAQRIDRRLTALVMDTPAPSRPQRIAIALAAGGTFWGLFLLAAFGPAALLPVPFGVGYLVTAGYWVRAISFPALAVRQTIWVVSFAVQGWWLLFVGLADAPGNGPNLFSAWWAFATLCSAVAFATEWGQRQAEPGAAPDTAR